MELQFIKEEFPCMLGVTRQMAEQELVYEFKLPETMPQIGRVVGSWGQVILRGKQWESNSLEVSGGLMASVLYCEEDSAQLQCVEEWIPFQIQCDIPHQERDGKFNTCCFLRFTDARTVSARKIMFRAGVGVIFDGYVPQRLDVYRPDMMPEHIQILKNTYPVCVPSEIGEKGFSLDEMLKMPSACPQIDRIIYKSLRVEIIDQKLLAQKVVFRGSAVVNVFYISKDGTLCSNEFEIPFSQYHELDYDYNENASVVVEPIVTGIEMDLSEDGSIALKAGILAQYIVYDCRIVELTEDAYSTEHVISTENQCLQMDAVLDFQQETIRIESSLQEDVMRIVDTFCCNDAMEIVQQGNGMNMAVSCQYQILFYDSEGKLNSAVVKGQSEWVVPSSEEITAFATVRPIGKVQCIPMGAGVTVQCDLLINERFVSSRGLEMISSIHTGEKMEKDTEGAALILCRVSNQRLWDIAKKYGSTIDRIKSANGIEEPVNNRMLLIPIN